MPAPPPSPKPSTRRPTSSSGWARPTRRPRSSGGWSSSFPRATGRPGRSSARPVSPPPPRRGMHDVVDLRSDTLTTPTPAMRRAMAEAEVGGIARLSLCQTRPLRSERGLPDPAEVRQAIRPRNIHIPPTGLIALENTHNLKGGIAFTPEEIEAVATIGREHGVPVHLDGARLFNAMVALDRDAREYGRAVDTVQFCLSKGLAAPVGSLLVAPADFIGRPRRIRKLLGG